MEIHRHSGPTFCLLAALALPAQGASYPAQPALGDGVICVSDAGVVCLDRAEPSRQWAALNGEHTLEPVIAGPVVLVGGGAGLHAFDAASGEPLWQWRSDGLVFPPTVDDGVVYASDENGRLRALELSTGRRLWQRRFDGWSYPPAVVQGRLVTGGRGGVVRALSAADGTTLWQQSLQQELVYRPVAAGQLAIVTTFDGRIVAFDGEGERAWTARDPVASFSPAVAGDLLLFGGWDGRLRARRLTTGESIWSRKIGNSQLDLLVRVAADGAGIGLTTPDGEVLLLHPDSGRIERRTAPIPGRIGTPFRGPGDGWVILVRRSGTIAPIGLSHLLADE